jgi:hypothetical protein
LEELSKIRDESLELEIIDKMTLSCLKQAKPIVLQMMRFLVDKKASDNAEELLVRLDASV